MKTIFHICFFHWIIIVLLGTSCTKTDTTDDPVTPPLINSVNIDSSDILYLGSGYAKDVFAIDAKTGIVIWKKTLNNQSTSAAVTNNIIIVKDYKDKLTAFDTLGNITWTFQLQGDLGSSPYIPVIADNGSVYAQDQEFVYSINAADGTIKWKLTKDPSHYMGAGAMILKKDVLYVAAALHIYAINISNGSIKWTAWSTGAMYSPVVLDDLMYVPVYLSYINAEIMVFDLKDGRLIKSLLGNTVVSHINVKYGKIYDVSGKVYDSATATTRYPDLQNFTDFNSPQGSPDNPWIAEKALYPIIADSLVILPGSVSNAITGASVCHPSNVHSAGSTGGDLSGATYVNHILYYATKQRSTYDIYSGGKYYADVFAYDIKADKLLWHTVIENANFFGVEPTVVTRSKKVFRGAYEFR